MRASQIALEAAASRDGCLSTYRALMQPLRMSTTFLRASLMVLESSVAAGGFFAAAAFFGAALGLAGAFAFAGDFLAILSARESNVWC